MHVEAMCRFVWQNHTQLDVLRRLMRMFDNGGAIKDVTHVRHLSADQSMEISLVVVWPLSFSA